MAQARTLCYLYYGEDDLSREEATRVLMAQVGGDPSATSLHEGTELNVAQIVSMARSLPMFAERRTLIIKDLLSFLTTRGEAGKHAVEQLVEGVASLPESACLVLVERGELRKDNKFLKFANQHERCSVKYFDAPKDSTEWIIRRTKGEYGAQITPQAAHALATVVGNDLRRADNELVKLVSYVDSKRPIEEADVALLTPYVAEANAFKLVDALIGGDAKTAMRLIHITLQQDPSDPGFRLFGLIVSQFRSLLLVREYLSDGGHTRDMASSLGIHPFVAEKLSKQSRAFSLEDLEDVYRRLHCYDVDMKTGKISPELALDLLVAQLARTERL
jgi:DNA polymerase-3 subunit delta